MEGGQRSLRFAEQSAGARYAEVLLLHHSFCALDPLMDEETEAQRLLEGKQLIHARGRI